MNAFSRAQRAWEATWVNGPKDDPWEGRIDPSDLSGDDLLQAAQQHSGLDLTRHEAVLWLDALHAEILHLEEPVDREPTESEMILVDALFSVSLRFRDMLI